MSENNNTSWFKRNGKLLLGIGISIVLILLSFVVQNHVGFEIPWWARLFTYLSFLSAFLFIYILCVKNKRVLLANIILLFLLVITVEIACFFLLGMPSYFRPKFEKVDLPDDHIAKQIGVIPFADSVYHEVKMNGTDTVFDSRVSIDQFNKRVTPGHDSTKTDFALFFGCSICNGYGLNDDQTLAYYYQHSLKNVNAYNFGISGHGTNNVLARIENQDLTQQVSEKNGVGLYIFFWDHIYRAIGSMCRYTSWVHAEPYYTMENGKLIRKKDFKEGRKEISAWYEKLYQTNIAKYFELDLPLALNDSHYDLVSEMVLESKKKYKAQFGNDDFYIVIYPSYKEFTDEQMNRFKYFLKKKGIQIIDLSEFISYGSKYTFNGDPHPNAYANKLVAKELEKRIRLKKFN